MDRNTTREFVHGLTALILSLFLLGISSGLGVQKSIVDILGAVLFIPEYPAVILRDKVLAWRSQYRGLDELNAEISRLREENARLRLASAKDFAVSDDVTRKIARVTLRAPMSWWSEMRIDRGEQDGIKQGQPVFSEGYLVGRVSVVGLNSAWVELITSSGFMIPAVVDQTRELGVVAGEGNGAVFLKYIPVGRGERSGLNVSTAMIGEQLPAGLPIGRISSSAGTGADGYATYTLALGADLSRLYNVNF